MPAGQLLGTEKKSNANYPQFVNAPLKMFVSPVLIGRKLLKNIGLNGRKIKVLPGAPALKFTRL
jgi:hypothetical protein